MVRPFFQQRKRITATNKAAVLIFILALIFTTTASAQTEVIEISMIKIILKKWLQLPL
jgi:hypothetical protein